MSEIQTDRQILEEIQDCVKDIRSAFLKNDDGDPDYAGHRHYHKVKVEEAKEVKTKKDKITSDLLTWAIIGLITLILSELIRSGPGILSFLGK